MAPRARAPEVLDRNELVEDPVVEHERQPAGALGLEPDEASRGRVHLEELDRATHPFLDSGAGARRRDAAAGARRPGRPPLAEAHDGTAGRAASPGPAARA